jgi:virginiamycin B lyase
MRRIIALGVTLLLAAGCAPEAELSPLPPGPTASPTEQGSPTEQVTPTAPRSPTRHASPTAAASPLATSAPDQPASPARTVPPAAAYSFEEFAVAPGGHPHDVAPARDDSVWYTAQSAGRLGRLRSINRNVDEMPLGEGSAPHGVIVGPDEAAWITDAGLNAIVRVDSESLAVTSFPLPTDGPANLNTAAFDGSGALWFTGNAGSYGRVVPATGIVDVFAAPRGAGPYGITGTPSGDVWFASLGGSYIARIDSASGEAHVFEPPTSGQGARRVWSDSLGRLWISEWNAGQLGMYDPLGDEWREWKLPGTNPQPYAVYVDELDLIWLTDFGSNSLLRFDPATEAFESFPFPSAGAEVRQLLGREGELWGAESGTDKLVVLRRGLAE